MYTLIKRTVPPPASMAIFDASNRDLCEVKRLKTNTPLQALGDDERPGGFGGFPRVLAARLSAT
jgi:hypothetical protein